MYIIIIIIVKDLAWWPVGTVKHTGHIGGVSQPLAIPPLPVGASPVSSSSSSQGLGSVRALQALQWYVSKWWSRSVPWVFIKIIINNSKFGPRLLVRTSLFAASLHICEGICSLTDSCDPPVGESHPAAEMIAWHDWISQSVKPFVAHPKNEKYGKQSGE